MPLRDFTCKTCATRFEALLKHDETACCPSCGGAHLERHLSAFARPASDGFEMASADSMGCGTCGDPRGPGACRWDN